MSIKSLFSDWLVVIKGAGDLASGVAYRLKRSGFPLVMTELPFPLLVRRTVSFGEAVYSGETTVEDIVARRIETPEEALRLAGSEIIPVLVDPAAGSVPQLKPRGLVDAIMAKVNTGTSLADAPLVIALGPGFTAGQDCHVVIETNRGHRLGRVIYTGQAEANTGTPGKIQSHTADRVLRAPVDGQLMARARIGDLMRAGDVVAEVNGRAVRAPFPGVLRGLIHSDVPVTAGLKIADLDPRGDVSHCYTISEKSLAIGGGVLEAILASQVRENGKPDSQ
jgi:xanthine dehydrogenase accessory factor